MSISISNSCMVPKELHSGSSRWVPATIIVTLRLISLSVTMIIILQCTNSSAVALNKTGARVPLKSDEKLFEIHKRLRAINKPAVKSIQSPDGDIIDCILRRKQLAFDDPLLRNHTIQEFSTIPSGIRLPSMANRTLKHPLQIWHLTGVRCPAGTIPVRRTSAEDLIRYESHRLYDMRKFRDQLSIAQKPADDPPDFYRDYAVLYIEGDAYYGTSMIADVWNPRLGEYGDLSNSQMWILEGYPASPELNSIEVGWQVHDPLYGDTSTRFFIFWTRDRYHSTGCYNLQCAGFVQTNQEVALGGAFSKISSYDGLQFEILIFVWMDQTTGHWWLYLQNYGRIGYFPNNILTLLAHHASHIEWGGEAGYYAQHGEHGKVQMGSGQFAEEGFGRASYIRNLQLVDENRLVVDLENAHIDVTASNCYNLHADSSAEWGSHFYFGGPGRNSLCLQRNPT